MNEQYRALTRAYRPQTFEDIVSQEHVSSTLRNAIRNNRLTHAYMFCGPRGVGKTTMARVLAREVNRVDDDVDGEALSRTLNIVEMDAASNRKIEDIRSLKEVIRVPPQNGRFKIFIIDEVHMLTKEAFNALLKTLEEPPGHAIFIFATTEPHKVLPTILSRVQRFDFKRIAVEEIVDRLRGIAEKESIDIDEEALHVIAKRADGALRDALGLLDQAIAFCGTRIEYQELLKALNVVGVEELFEFTDLIRGRDSGRGLGMIEKLIRSGTDIQEFLVSLTEHLRNLYVAGQADRLYLVEATEETRKRYQEHSADFGEKDLMRMLHLVSETQQKLKDAGQPRIQFEILMLKLVHMNNTRDLGTLLDEVRELKKKAADGELILSSPQQAASEAESSEREEDRDAGFTDSPKESSKATGGSAEPRTEPQTGREKETNGQKSFEPDEENTDGLNRPDSADPGVSESLQRGGDEILEPEEDELFGRPSIEGLREQHPAVTVPSGTDRTEAAGSSVSASRPVQSLEEIQDRWSRVLELLEQCAPRTVYFQMQRVELIEMNGRELVVRTNNEFAQRLLEENQQVLTSGLKSVLGAGFRITCKVSRGSKKEQETVSPYERFRELQRKDPRLRTIVELFGAELEY